MKSKHELSEEAEHRLSMHHELTPSQRLAKLDARLGPGVGARKERARLHNLIHTTKGSEDETSHSILPGRR